MAIELKNFKTNTKNKKYNFQHIVSLLNKDIQFGINKLKDKKKESFYSELQVLLSSGIDMRTALDIVVDEQKSEIDKKLFEGIKSEVISGISLSKAIQNTGKFSQYEYYSIKIGEESGRIKEVLIELSIFFTKKIKQRRQLTSALTYPVMVIVTAFLSVGFMLNFIVPMFIDVFKRFNGEMPGLTKMVISLSLFMKAYIWLFLLIIIGMILTILYLRRKEFFRARVTYLILKLPLFGEITKKIYLTRYCQSMALLLGAKTPMINALQLISKMIEFYPFEKAMEKMEFDILHGKLLHQSMSQFDFFDSRIISLVRVAEEVNQLENIFTKLSVQYNDELEYKIGMLSSLLEPIMIILVGLLVAVILISMYLPLFQLSSTMY